MFVTYSLLLLLVLVVYPVPESSNGILPKNSFRHFLGRLHRPQDFQFLVDGMTRILNQPVPSDADLHSLIHQLTERSFKQALHTFQVVKSRYHGHLR